MRRVIGSLNENWSIWLLAFVAIISLILKQLDYITDEYVIELVLIIVTTFSVNTIIQNNKTIRILKEIKSTNGQFERLSQDDFYNKLTDFVEHASQFIDLTYNSPYNLTINSSKFQKIYFSKLDKKILKDDIRIRRIVTINSIEKLDLIVRWVNKYKHLANFHIRYTKLSPDEINQTLSLQISDGKRLLIGGIDNGMIKRSCSNIDLYIEDEIITSAFTKKYENTWQSLEYILEESKVNYDLLEKIREELSHDK